MPRERPAEPWSSFLSDLDAHNAQDVDRRLLARVGDSFTLAILVPPTVVGDSRVPLGN